VFCASSFITTRKNYIKIINRIWNVRWENLTADRKVIGWQIREHFFWEIDLWLFIQFTIQQYKIERYVDFISISQLINFKLGLGLITIKNIKLVKNLRKIKTEAKNSYGRCYLRPIQKHTFLNYTWNLGHTIDFNFKPNKFRFRVLTASGLTWPQKVYFFNPAFYPKISVTFRVRNI
jgi:hypothetical protein